LLHAGHLDLVAALAHEAKLIILVGMEDLVKNFIYHLCLIDGVICRQLLTVFLITAQGIVGIRLLFYYFWNCILPDLYYIL